MFTNVRQGNAKSDQPLLLVHMVPAAQSSDHTHTCQIHMPDRQHRGAVSLFSAETTHGQTLYLQQGCPFTSFSVSYIRQLFVLKRCLNNRLLQKNRPSTGLRYCVGRYHHRKPTPRRLELVPKFCSCLGNPPNR